MKRRTVWISGAIVVALIVVVVLSSGPPPPTPNRAGTFSFAVFGDAPYYPWEEIQYPLVLREIRSNDLKFVIHVGDIWWRPCTDAMYEKTLERFNSLPQPVIYTPGDNEWTDCWEPGSGRYAPLERLAHIRQIFFRDPTHTIGQTRLKIVSQAQDPHFSEFSENARWEEKGIVFATVDLPGSRTAMKPFPGRTAADDNAARRRTLAAAEWTRQTFAEAAGRGAVAVVIGFQANPDFEAKPDTPYRAAFEPFMVTLEEETERFRKPVLVVHGDGHRYLVDHPLVRRTTGRTLLNFTRMQVPGSPRVGWVRVVVAPAARSPFSFENHVVPRWKYW